MPRRDASYEKLRVRSDPATGELLETTVIDLLGNVTQVAFSHTRTNLGPADALFSFPRDARRPRDRARAPDAQARRESARPRRRLDCPNQGERFLANPGAAKFGGVPGFVGGVGGSPTQASKLRQLRRNIASRGGRGCATASASRRSAVRSAPRRADARRRRDGRAARARARAQARERRGFRGLRGELPAPLSLTGGGRLIDFASAESCDISRCSALLRPPAEVGGTSLRSVSVSGRRGAGNADEEPSHARCKRARVVLPGAFCDQSAEHAARLQPHRAAQRSVEMRASQARAARASRRSCVRLRSVMRVRGMGLADLVRQRRSCPCGRRMNEEMAA